MDGPRVGQMEQDRTNHVEGSSLSPFLIPPPSHVCQAEPLSVKLQNGSPLAEKAHPEVNGDHTWLHFKANYGMTHAAKGNTNNRISPDLLQEKRDCTRHMQNGGIKRTFSEPSLYGLHQNKKLKQDNIATVGKDTSLSSSNQSDVSNSCSEKDCMDFRVEKNAASLQDTTEVKSSRYNCGASETPHTPPVPNEQESKDVHCHNGDIVLLHKNKAVPIPNGAIVCASSMENMHGELLEKTLSQYNPDHVSIAMQKTTSLTHAINTRATSELACGTPHSPHTSGQISSPQTSNSELPPVLATVATEVHNSENSSKPPILPECYTFKNLELQLMQQNLENTHQSPTVKTDVPGNIGQVPDPDFSLPNPDFALNPCSNLKSQNNSTEGLPDPAVENGALFHQDSMFKKDSFSPPPVSASSPAPEINNILSIAATEGQNSYETQKQSTQFRDNNNAELQQGELAAQVSVLTQQALGSQQGLQQEVANSQKTNREPVCDDITAMALGIMQKYPEEMKPKLEPHVQDPQILGSNQEMQEHCQQLLGEINQEILADNEKDLIKDPLQQTHPHSQSSWTGMASPHFCPSNSPPKSNEVLMRTMLQLQSNSGDQTHPKQYPGSPRESKRASGHTCYQNIIQRDQLPALYKHEPAQVQAHLPAEQQMQFQKHSPQLAKMDTALKSHEQQQNTKHFHFQPPAECHTEQSLETQFKPQHLNPPTSENEQFLHSHILEQMLQAQPAQLPQGPQLTLSSQPQQGLHTKNREHPQTFPHSRNIQEQQLERTPFNQLKLEECFETANNYFKSTELPVQNPQAGPEQTSGINNKDSLYDHTFKQCPVMKHSYPNSMHLISEKKENVMNPEHFAENLQHMQYYPNSLTAKQEVPHCFQEQKAQSPQTSAAQLPFQQTQGYSNLNTTMCETQQATQMQQRYSPYSQQAPSHDQRGCHLPSQPPRDFQKHAALRWHILNKQEQQVNQNKSETFPSMGHRPIKAEAGSKSNVCLRPSVGQLENKTWKKTIKQEVQHFGCENLQQKSIIETMEQQLKQIQVKTLFDHKSLTIKSPKHVKLETAGPITILSRNSTAADFNSYAASFDQQAIHPNEKTPTKRTAGSALNHFLESPSKLFDTPVKNLLDTPVKTQYDFPSCSCVGE